MCIRDSLKAAQLVIEAATENYELKLKILKQADALLPPEVIVASNTSSISITKPVSYTHLDVYKRQLHSNALLLQVCAWTDARHDHNLGRLQRTGRHQHLPRGADLVQGTGFAVLHPRGTPPFEQDARGVGAVSYTHLDVYKRQVSWVIS